jgi:protein-disulfide isomerase
VGILARTGNSLSGAGVGASSRRTTVSPKKRSTAANPLPQLILPVEASDHCIGVPGAKYSLVEYGDYECEHCAHVHPIVRELVRELGDDVCYVFRNFPRTEEHPHAQRAAEAAEAADMQGKYWLMHDRLFEHFDGLSEELIVRLARELPIQMSDFEKDLGSGAPARRVAADVETGEEAGVEETPTFFVNGRMHVGSYEFLPLLEALQGHT